MCQLGFPLPRISHPVPHLRQFEREAPPIPHYSQGKCLLVSELAKGTFEEGMAFNVLFRGRQEPDPTCGFGSANRAATD